MPLPVSDYEKLLRVCEGFIYELRHSPALPLPGVLADRLEALVNEVRPTDDVKHIAESWVEWFNSTYNRKFRCTPQVVQLVRALTKQWYSEDDIRVVTASLVAQWSAKPEMVQFIRPSSLLTAEKFGERLDEARRKDGTYRPPSRTQVYAPPTIKDAVPREEIRDAVSTVVARLKGVPK